MVFHVLYFYLSDSYKWLDALLEPYYLDLEKVAVAFLDKPDKFFYFDPL